MKKHLDKINLIKACDEVVFDQETKEDIRSKLGQSLADKAAQNSLFIRVFRIVYRSNGHNVVGFMLIPSRLRKKIPCIIYNRGGLGAFGQIELGDLFLRFPRFVQWGYVLITTQYSGNGGSEGTDGFGDKDINDVLNLYKILKNYPYSDCSRVGMYGPSRGGMMVYKSLRKVSWIKAAVTVAGLADVRRQISLRPEIKKHLKPCFKLNKQNLDGRSAVKWADKIKKKTPVLLLHGSADWRVSVEDSLDMARLFFRNKIPYRLVVFEGDDHSLSEHNEEKWELTRFWFDQYVKYAKSLPNLKLHGK